MIVIRTHTFRTHTFFHTSIWKDGITMNALILKELSKILTEKTGLDISFENIHEASRIFFYIPEADPGRPLFLHHYRGPFFVQIPKADWHKLETGEISPLEYIDTAHWYFGFYWAYHGGYFTPLECTAGIHDKELIRRVMKPFSCRGCSLVSGYRPTKSTCLMCDLTYCPYSAVAEKTVGETSELADLPDNRRDFFEAVDRFLQKESGYELKGLFYSENMPIDEIELIPNKLDRSFRLIIGDQYVKQLFYFPMIAGFNWDREVEAKKIRVFNPAIDKSILIESPEDFERALNELEIIATWEAEEERSRQLEEKNSKPPLEIDFDFSVQDKPESIWTRFCDWLKGLFR